MSQVRTQLRAQARSDFRANEIVEGKCKVGKTQKLRVALSGNNPSVGKRTFQAQKRAGKMLRHARLVVALLIRAAGGSASTAYTVEGPQLDAYKSRIARMGTSITNHYPVTTKSRRNKKTAERRERNTESRGQRLARKGKIARANTQVLRDLAAGKYGKSGVEQAAEAV